MTASKVAITMDGSNPTVLTTLSAAAWHNPSRRSSRSDSASGCFLRSAASSCLMRWYARATSSGDSPSRLVLAVWPPPHFQQSREAASCLSDASCRCSRLLCQGDPSRDMIAGLLPAAYFALHAGRVEQLCRTRVQQEMVDTNACIPSISIAEVVPERVDRLVWMEFPEGVGPALR